MAYTQEKARTCARSLPQGSICWQVFRASGRLVLQLWCKLGEALLALVAWLLRVACGMLIATILIPVLWLLAVTCIIFS